MRNLLCLLFLLFASLTIVAQTRSDKRTIDIGEVNYIEIHKIDSKSKVHTKKLDVTQAELFAHKWNTSTGLGADKYKPKYFIWVYLNDGKKRQFTISGNKIQESGWMTYDIKDKTYFDVLWKSIQ